MREEKRCTKSPPNNETMALGTYISIATLNVNELKLQPKGTDQLNG